MQCGAVWTTVYDTRFVATSYQCHSSSRHWSWFSGPRDWTDERALLVTNKIPYQFQVMSDDARHCDWSSPQYIRDIVHPLSTLPGQNRLRAAASGQIDIPTTRTVFGERAFSVAGPCEWNTLPQNIIGITNREAFKRALKTLF